LEIKPSRWKSNHPVGNQTTGVKSKQRFFLWSPQYFFMALNGNNTKQVLLPNYMTLLEQKDTQLKYLFYVGENYIFSISFL
jgi:hypothetical protein